MEIVTGVIEAAQKLAQGGIVFVLVFLLLIAVYGCFILFNAYKEMALRTVTAIEGNTNALNSHTRAVEEATRTSEANRASFDTFRMLLENMIRNRAP